jgi:O-antigen/teichoic acid export membrane protein
LAYGSIIFFGGFKIFKENPKEVFQISLKNVKKTFTYGLGNETSNFFQFLNYRLTFYFIVENLGYSELGVFSVAVSIAEAILIISKSTSSIHFSNVLNNNDSKQNIIKTSLLAKQNLLICVGLCFIFYFIPNDLFIYIFGNSFYEVKMLTIYLFPGIIAIAASNLYGHYFAGIGNYKVLKNKSYLGFIATIVFAILLIPSFNLIGACITMNLSYIVSSIFLYYKFTLDQSKLNNE